MIPSFGIDTLPAGAGVEAELDLSWTLIRFRPTTKEGAGPYTAWQLITDEKIELRWDDLWQGAEPG